MTVFVNSRYRFRDMVLVQDETLTKHAVHKIRKTTDTGPKGYRMYTCSSGDTFESLAWRFYGDGDKWYVLADANPEIFFPLELTSGTQIRVPATFYAQVK